MYNFNQFCLLPVCSSYCPGVHSAVPFFSGSFPKYSALKLICRQWFAVFQANSRLIRKLPILYIWIESLDSKSWSSFHYALFTDLWPWMVLGSTENLLQLLQSHWQHKEKCALLKPKKPFGNNSWFFPSHELIFILIHWIFLAKNV